ncbi:HWE histidine kinase domain-containing protein [Halovulum sp. GXIMD14794]
MSFLAGSGEMAQRIRNFPWRDHPFGPPETWPQSLRSALGICLNSAFPTAIYWGSDLRLLYNDAWSTIPGPRHPACLGEPAAEVWADIWHVIEPQFAHLIESGEGIFVQDQMLPMRRYGFEEETYWNYSFTPIRGEDGAIEGVFNSGSETTDHVLKRRRSEFLLQLTDRFRASPDADDTLQAACAALGAHLGALRVGIRELGGDSAMRVSAEWTPEGVPRRTAKLAFESLGPVAQTLRDGHVVRIDDTGALPEPELRALFDDLGARAVLNVPWVENRVLTAVLFIHLEQPRKWTDETVETVEQVLERTLNSVERERARQREKVMIREIDHRSRNVLAVVRALTRLADAPDVESYKVKLLDRLRALSVTHGLLADNRWSGISLGTLVGQELSPYVDAGDGRVRSDGPDILLEPQMAQTLAMIFHELATNAAKYGALAVEGGTLSVGWSAQQNDWVRLSWTETLPGVPESEEGGTGFGSSLLEQLVERQLSGRIRRRLSPAGLRCEMELPLSAQAAEAAPSKPAEPAPDGQGGARVLVVEDDPIIGMDLADSLDELGFHVQSVERTVASAVAAIEADAPDVAVIDIHLGKELSAPVAEALTAQGVPYVVMTGYDSPETIDPAYENRPRITKPFSSPELKARLSELGAHPDTVPHATDAD